jgi:hypothetical protein
MTTPIDINSPSALVNITVANAAKAVAIACTGADRAGLRAILSGMCVTQVKSAAGVKPNVIGDAILLALLNGGSSLGSAKKKQSQMSTASAYGMDPTHRPWIFDGTLSISANVDAHIDAFGVLWGAANDIKAAGPGTTEKKPRKVQAETATETETVTTETETDKDIVVPVAPVTFADTVRRLMDGADATRLAEIAETLENLAGEARAAIQAIAEAATVEIDAENAAIAEKARLADEQAANKPDVSPDVFAAKAEADRLAHIEAAKASRQALQAKFAKAA